MAYGDDNPAKSSDHLFESCLDYSDHKMIESYENAIKNTTLGLTGLEVNQRLKRIEAESKRLGTLQEQMARLKRITKATLLGVADDGRDD